MMAVSAVTIVSTPSDIPEKIKKYMEAAGRECLTMNELRKALNTSNTAYYLVASRLLDTGLLTFLVFDKVKLLCTKRGAVRLLRAAAAVIEEATVGAKTVKTAVRLRTLTKKFADLVGLDYVVASRIMSSLTLVCARYHGRHKLVRLSCPVEAVARVVADLRKASALLEE